MYHTVMWKIISQEPRIRFCMSIVFVECQALRRAGMDRGIELEAVMFEIERASTLPVCGM